MTREMPGKTGGRFQHKCTPFVQNVESLLGPHCFLAYTHPFHMYCGLWRLVGKGFSGWGRSMTIIRKSPANCCKNCHFLAKTHIDRGGVAHRFSWDKEERDNYHSPDHHSAECAKGIWSTRIDPSLEKSLNRILLENRKDDCFFIKTHDGMSFETASELHRLRNDNRQLKRSYRYTQIGLLIAAFGLLANVVMEIIKAFGFFT